MRASRRREMGVVLVIGVLAVVGCAPVLPDRDGDRIPDVRDRCPDAPENYDHSDKSPLTADGCPGTRRFHYCVIRRLRLGFVGGRRLTDRSARGIARLVSEFKRRGIVNHRLFMRVDLFSFLSQQRRAVVESIVKRAGLKGFGVVTEHEDTRCVRGGDRHCWRKPLPIYHGLELGEPTLVLLRIQGQTCRAVVARANRECGGDNLAACTKIARFHETGSGGIHDPRAEGGLPDSRGSVAHGLGHPAA